VSSPFFLLLLAHKTFYESGYFKTVLEIPAIERRGLYSPLTQEWLAETPEQQQQLSHINHKRAMLPGPQWMKCFKPVGSTGFDCHETDPMSRFRRAGFRFSTCKLLILR